MKQTIKRIITFTAYVFIGVIGINCINLSIEVKAPNGIDLDHRMPYMIKVDHSGRVQLEVNVPYGVAIQ